MAALLAMLLTAVLASGCTNEQDNMDVAKERVTQVLVQHGDLREFLENDLYALGGDLIITTPDGYGYQEESAVILSNGKLSIPLGLDAELQRSLAGYEKQIVDIFGTFHCVTMSLNQPVIGDPTGPMKVVAIIFDDIRINDDVYAQRLSYSRDGVVESGSGTEVRVFKDWYYATPAYH